MTATRRRGLIVVGAIAAIVLAVVAVLLWRSGIQTSSYPPVELDGKTISGPYELSRYSGSRVGWASIVALFAVLALAWSVRAAFTTRHHP